MSENIEIENIEAKDTSENSIDVEICDSTEALISAHNSSETSHISIREALNSLSNTVSEIESNMASYQNIPTKLSDLENDLNFTSEESVANALEIREIVNLTTLEEKISESELEIRAEIYDNTSSIGNLESTKLNIQDASKMPLPKYDSTGVINFADNDTSVHYAEVDGWVTWYWNAGNIFGATMYSGGIGKSPTSLNLITPVLHNQNQYAVGITSVFPIPKGYYYQFPGHTYYKFIPCIGVDN